VWGVLGRPAASGAEDLLGVVVGGLVDDRWVRGLVGVHPCLGGVPAQFGGVAEGDVLDIEQDFLLALLVPDLPAGVAGVGQDHPDRALGPGDA
jgi:hypothetical protein